MAGSNRLANGSLPCFFESSTHAETHPGTVTDSHPSVGTDLWSLKRSGVHPAGERPEALSPTRRLPSQRIANTSEPMPLEVGSTTVSVIAAARPASTALPPRASAARPACAASGCDVATTFRARTGMRCEAYGNCQENIAGSGGADYRAAGANGSIG